jgi:hypothetical protein
MKLQVYLCTYVVAADPNGTINGGRVERMRADNAIELRHHERELHHRTHRMYLTFPCVRFESNSSALRCASKRLDPAS